MLKFFLKTSFLAPLTANPLAFNLLWLWRLLTFFYLSLHLWLWWQPAVNAYFYFGLVVLSFLVSTFISFKRYLWAVAFFIPFLVRGIVEVIEVLFYKTEPLLLTRFDLSFTPSIAVALLLFALNLAFRVFPLYRPYEALVRLALFVATFWAMGNYRLFFYNHYNMLMLFLAFYLLVEVSFFIFVSNPKVSKKKYGFTLFLGILPLLSFPLIFSKLSANMVQYHGGLLEPTLSSFDFSTSLQLENEISLDNNLILLLKTEPPLAQKTLFKRFTLAGYSDSKGFHQLEGYGDIDYLPSRPTMVQLTDIASRKPLQQEVFVVNLESNALVAAHTVARVVPYQNWQESKFKRVYKVHSLLVNDELDLSLQPLGKLSPQEQNLYLQTGNNPEIEQLAHTVTDGLPTAYLKAEAIQDFFKDNYLYSLKIGNLTAEKPLNQFLFESRKGYCSYFAYSMALMLRYLQIPSRVVTGFWADETLENSGYYPITANLAHAWVEVYFNEVGWVNFDPTSDRLDPNELGGVNQEAPSNLDLFIDEANTAQLTPEEELQDAEVFTPPAPLQEQKPMPTRNRLLLFFEFILVLFGLYITLIAYLRKKLDPKEADFPVRQALGLAQKVFFYGYLEQKWDTFEAFLKAEPALAKFYRKARFSQGFSKADLKELDEQATILLQSFAPSTFVKKVKSFLNPKQWWVFIELGVK